MRTNIEIDDRLMRQAMKAAGATTKKGAVEQGLQLLVRLKAQEGIRELRGKVKWEGNLDEMRQGRFMNWQEDAEKAGSREQTISELISKRGKAS
jgi:Arc/MetJ family transcription regulator